VTWTAVETGEGATLWQYTDQARRRHNPHLPRAERCAVGGTGCDERCAVGGTGCDVAPGEQDGQTLPALVALPADTPAPAEGLLEVRKTPSCL
jgi:hypothetical protein